MPDFCGAKLVEIGMSTCLIACGRPGPVRREVSDVVCQFVVSRITSSLGRSLSDVASSTGSYGIAGSLSRFPAGVPGDGGRELEGAVSFFVGAKLSAFADESISMDPP